MGHDEFPEGTPFGVSLVAGALAGIAEHTITFPLDSIKTRLQVLSPTATYSGTMDAVARISTTEGLRQLWRGVWSVVIGAGPAHAIYFAAYEQSKVVLKGKAELEAWEASVAGMVATTLSDAFMNPFDVVKQRMQMHASPHSGIVACFKTVLRNEGFCAFYRSYPTTLLLNVPFHSIQFPIYESLRSVFAGMSSERNPLVHIVAGGVAGGTAGLLTTPIDVVKTTLQTSSHVASTMGAIRAIFEQHGVSGFFRGAVPRTLAFIPSTAICWGCYEYFKLHLKFD